MPGWNRQLETLGAFIRHQRRVADLSLRELAALTSVSNAYLSQVERGLHQPSIKVLTAIGDALGVPAVSLLAEAGMLEDTGQPRPVRRGSTAAPSPGTEQAIRADPELGEREKEALIAVYRSYLSPRPDPPPV